jgi:ABC-type Fe3+ transport system substrate-binding protein
MTRSLAIALGAALLAAACGPAAPATPAASAAPGSPARATTAVALYQQLTGKTRDQQLGILEKGAREEGKLDLFASGDEETVTAWVAGFKRAYPFLDVNVTRGSTRTIAERFITQARAGQPVGDVFYAGIATLAQIRQEDLFAVHLIPDAERIPADLRNDHGLWDVTRLASHHVVFNTKLTSADRLPATFDAFTGPEWKGKFAINSDAKEWFACQVKRRGLDAAAAFMRAIVANQPVIMEGKTVLLERLVLGDFPVNIDNTGSSGYDVFKTGAPIGFKSLDPICVTLTGGGVAKHAKDPNAATLFLNWQTSDEAQRIFAGYGYLPINDAVQPFDPGLRSKTAKLVYLTEADVDPKSYDPLSKLHTEIVVRKR